MDTAQLPNGELREELVKFARQKPSRVDLTAYRANAFVKFPADPDKEYVSDTSPSTNIVVPGQNVVAIVTADSPLIQPEMDMFTTNQLTYFAFAKIE
jgi:hypothetical protein